jgi:hypothetical protein
LVFRPAFSFSNEFSVYRDDANDSRRTWAGGESCSKRALILRPFAQGVRPYRLSRSALANLATHPRANRFRRGRIFRMGPVGCTPGRILLLNARSSPPSSVAETDVVSCYGQGRSWCPVHYTVDALYQDASNWLHSTALSSRGLGPLGATLAGGSRNLRFECTAHAHLYFVTSQSGYPFCPCLFLVERMNKLLRCGARMQPLFSSLFPVVEWINWELCGFRFKCLNNGF